MNDKGSGHQNKTKSNSSAGVSKVEKEIGEYLSGLANEKFTGEVLFRFRFNQGGIRDSRVVLEKSLQKP